MRQKRARMYVYVTPRRRGLYTYSCYVTSRGYRIPRGGLGIPFHFPRAFFPHPRARDFLKMRELSVESAVMICARRARLMSRMMLYKSQRARAVVLTVDLNLRSEAITTLRTFNCDLLSLDLTFNNLSLLHTRKLHNG